VGALDASKDIVRIVARADAPTRQSFPTDETLPEISAPGR